MELHLTSRQLERRLAPRPADSFVFRNVNVRRFAESERVVVHDQDHVARIGRGRQSATLSADVLVRDSVCYRDAKSPAIAPKFGVKMGGKNMGKNMGEKYG